MRATCSWCGDPLPPRRRRFCNDDHRRRGQRAERRTDSYEFGQAATRIIWAIARRASIGDSTAFAAVFDVMQECEAAVVSAIDELRARDLAWSEIAAEVEWSRQRLTQWRQRREDSGEQRNVAPELTTGDESR
jgi:hypothetical protein